LSVDSTNNYASELLKSQKLDEGTIIWAKSQVQGRGQKGNSWLSEDEKNITCSIVISPNFLPIEMQFYLSVVTSVSIAEFLGRKIDDVKIKWPNDIYYKDLKLGGILVENSIIGATIKNSIIGIGININQSNFSDELPNPVSLINITMEEYNLQTLLDEMSEHFLLNYERLKSGDLQRLKNEYLNYLYVYGEPQTYKDSNGEFTGKITDVMDSGELVILDESNKKRSYFFKEVEFVRK
jgi:BirA family biotin operon repressor/biotin-[acetyl-CoA-carboxylase] ligase